MEKRSQHFVLIATYAVLLLRQLRKRVAADLCHIDSWHLYRKDYKTNPAMVKN